MLTNRQATTAVVHAVGNDLYIVLDNDCGNRQAGEAVYIDSPYYETRDRPVVTALALIEYRVGIGVTFGFVLVAWKDPITGEVHT